MTLIPNNLQMKELKLNVGLRYNFNSDIKLLCTYSYKYSKTFTAQRNAIKYLQNVKMLTHLY